MKISNTKKHFFGGLFAGIGVAIILHLTNHTDVVYAVAICWAMITILFELAQLLFSGKRASYYFQEKWLDSLVDIIAGNAGYWLIMVVSIFGTYGGNLLR